MHQLLCTSPAVTSNNVFGTREGQALPEVRALVDYRRRWDAGYTYPWPAIKRIWTAYWAHHKPLRLDKSPPHLLRTRTLTQHFSPAAFVCMTRSPYAHCESLMRRNKMPAPEAAAFSLRCLQHQKHSLETLPRIRLIRYEDLVANPEQTKRDLLAFLPELAHLNVTRTFHANTGFNKPMPITDLNAGKWARIPRPAQQEIETTLAAAQDVLSYFGYGAIEAA